MRLQTVLQELQDVHRRSVSALQVDFVGEHASCQIDRRGTGKAADKAPDLRPDRGLAGAVVADALDMTQRVSATWQPGLDQIELVLWPAGPIDPRGDLRTTDPVRILHVACEPQIR